MAPRRQQANTSHVQRSEFDGHRVGVRAGLVAMLVLMLAGVGAVVALSRHDGRQAVVATEQVAPDPASDAPNTPSQVLGRTAVLDVAGKLRGYLDDKTYDEAMDSGDPVLAIGSGKVVAHGYEVRDESGMLPEYLMVPGGFVERSIASDPTIMDAWLVGQVKAQAEAKVRSGPAVKEMQDKMEREMLNEG